MTIEKIIITRSKTFEAARHSSCHSIICCKDDGSLLSEVVSLFWVLSLSIVTFFRCETPFIFKVGFSVFSSSSASEPRLSFLRFTDVIATFWFCSKTSVIPPQLTPPSERLKVSNVGLWIMSSVCALSVDFWLSLVENRLDRIFTLTRGANVLSKIVLTQPGIFVLL